MSGLAKVAHNLAVANATATIAKLEALKKTKKDDAVVETCLILYKGVLTPLRFAAEFAASKHYSVAVDLYGVSIDGPARCEDLMSDELTVDGDNLFKLTLMASEFTKTLASS
ncbi:hypothetical protein Cni_G06050 [Canna indica]|uniref:Pectinesterase inhibitor domain-containing protein n=1 Tax=Canna indica TaxID=4628 RepID=A0AAQ3Q5Z5_9LILI|nr:hypothetical protein Cni_G06050 [Canna indica]